MSKSDNELLAALFGGIIGASIAAPNERDKRELQEYRILLSEINRRQQRIGDLPYIVRLLRNPLYVNPFTEAYRMYLNGFYRGAVILQTAIIDSLLKEKYGEKDFYKRIEKAHKDGFIDDADYHLLHSIRSKRNYSTHEILQEVTEEDAILVIRIVNKIMHKFI